MKTTLSRGASPLGFMTPAERSKGRYMRAPDHNADDGNSDDNKSVEELAKEVKADFEKKFAEVKAIAEDAIGKAAKAEEMTQAEKD